jgi:PKD repeat protein
MLVNDLDLRLTRGGSTYYPWKLNRNSPASAATNSGENNVDNVEVVYIASPVAGTYTITVDHDGSISGGTQAFSMIISGIDLAQPPIANFIASPTVPSIGETVTFTDQSANNPTSWNWSFSGPGNANFVGGTNASSQNPQVQFDATGSYSATLVATNSHGSDGETKSNYINVTNCTYCNTSYSNTSDDYISNVTFNTINNSSGSTNYSDFTSISTDVTPGNTHNLSVEITVNGNWVQHCKVWFDWNQDCDFTDPGEEFDLGQTPGTTGTHTLSTNVTIPVSAQSGTTRMRVSELWNTDPQPCTSSTYGEAEDYSVNIGGDFTLNLKVYLEGPFNGSSMNTDINSILPLSQPFNMAPWNYGGTESVGSIPNPDVIDWVLVDLRDATSATTATPATSIAKQAAFLLSDGSIVDLDGSSDLQFGVSISQDLFVAVWQRNHLGVISANALVPSGSVYNYDFTSGLSQAYGGTSGHKEISIGVWGMIGGDGNHNEQIDSNDKDASWENQAGEKGYLFGDYNLDGEADNKDKDDIWVPNQGKSSQIPN